MPKIYCPRCNSNQIIKNGRTRGKQRYNCQECDQSFQETTIKKQDNRQIPEKAIILLTSHRSGSTWLSDAIRCHPAIDYYPTPILYEELGLYGRRYPGDLSNQGDCTYEIEVQPGKLDRIPYFNISPDLKPAWRKIQFEPYAVEKCHPSFFDFNSEIFLRGIKHLESLGVEVKLVYLIRDPKSLMTSFMDYQQRKPSWYREMIGEKLIDFITKTYQCIIQASKERTGVILDYVDLKTDMAQALLKIYGILWSDLNLSQQECLQRISKLALKHTNREHRLANTNSVFFGKEEGIISGVNQRYPDFFVTYRKLMEQCYSSYNEIKENQ